MSVRSIARGLMIGLAVLALWQALVIVLNLPPFMLPAPHQVFLSLAQRFDFFMHHASITGLETILGLFFGAVSGVVVALTMSLFPIAKRLVMPLIVISQALPVFAIAPLLVLWFGFGLASKIVMAMLIIFFPVASYFYDGLRRTDPELVDLGHLYRADRIQMLLHIRVPAALPALSSGLRVSAVFAPIGAIVGEWVGSSAGLGFIMLQANARMQTDSMFAALFLLALMALALRYTVTWLTQIMVPWQTEQ